MRRHAPYRRRGEGRGRVRRGVNALRDAPVGVPITDVSPSDLDIKLWPSAALTEYFPLKPTSDDDDYD